MAKIVMKKRGLFTALLLFLSLVVSHAVAQGFRFTTKVNNTTVGLDEPFQVQFTLENASQVSGFRPPEFKGFQVLSQSQYNSTNVVNGQMSQSVSFIYVLQADAVGRYTIAGASARVNGNPERSNPITLEVVKGNNTTRNNSSNNTAPANSSPFSFPRQQESGGGNDDIPGLLKKGEDPMGKIKKNVFVKVAVDKKDVYVGQQIIAAYKLYTRMPTSSQVTKVPAFTGFSAHDIELPNPPQATIERINGEAFKVFTIRKTMLFPLQSGTLELDPVEVDNTVRLYTINRTKPQRSDDPFADIFNDPFFKDPFGKDPFDDPMFEQAFGGGDVTYKDYNYHISSAPVKITVKPLPVADRPESFDGAVGDFSITATVDKSQLSTDDAGTLKITISGAGNITLLNAPKVDFPASFDSYDPKITDKVNKNSNPFSGSRSFEYVFMPKSAGDYTLGPVKFSYFDPEAKAYKTIESNSFNIKVTPGKNSNSGSEVDYSRAGNGLQPIHSGKLVWSRPAGGLWFGNWWHWTLMLLPLLILAGLLGYKKRQDKLNANQVLLKNKKANKVAKRRLSLAAKYLQQQNSKAFYEEISQAVWGYLSNKLNIPFAELSKERVEAGLRTKNIDGAEVQKLFGLLDNCEMALYAGRNGQEQMKDTYSYAMHIISELEERLKG